MMNTSTNAKPRRIPRFLLCLTTCGLPFFHSAAAPSPPPQWQPAPDDVYLQEIGRKIPSSVPLTSVAVYEGTVYAGSTSGLRLLRGNELVEIEPVRSAVHRLVVAGGNLWAITADGLLRLQQGAWKKLHGEPVNDLCEHGSEVVAAGRHRLWRVQGEALDPLSSAQSPFPISRVLSQGETLFVQGGNRLTFLEGQRFGDRDVYDSYTDQSWVVKPETTTAVTAGTIWGRNPIVTRSRKIPRPGARP